MLSKALMGAGGQGGGIEFVGGGSHLVAGTNADPSVSLTSLTGGIGSTAETDDLVVYLWAKVTSADTDMTMVTSGYTEVADLHLIDPGAITGIDFAVYYKKMGATPDTTAVANNTNGASNGIVHIGIAMVFRGVDTVTPLDVTSTTATGINQVHVNPPSITPVTTGAFIVALGGSAYTTTNRTYSESGVYENWLERDGVHAGAFNLGCAAFIGCYPWDGVGAEDPAQVNMTTSTANDSWASATLALRPA